MRVGCERDGDGLGGGDHGGERVKDGRRFMEERQRADGRLERERREGEASTRVDAFLLTGKTFRKRQESFTFALLWRRAHQ